MQIKICGITRVEEAGYLNEAGVDYAGFVFHEKSKRNVSIQQTKQIFEKLNKNIKKVAVMVSPKAATVTTLQKSGFDILQIHGTLSEEVLKAAQKPIWFAVNISDQDLLEEKMKFLSSLPPEFSSKIKGIVVDSAEYGSGKTFEWDTGRRWQSSLFENRIFILAGGLNADNVQTGIRLFLPDVVDVSSGVEITEGDATKKNKIKIKEFTGKVRSYEQ